MLDILYVHVNYKDIYEVLVCGNALLKKCALWKKYIFKVRHFSKWIVTGVFMSFHLIITTTDPIYMTNVMICNCSHATYVKMGWKNKWPELNGQSYLHILTHIQITSPTDIYIRSHSIFVILHCIINCSTAARFTDIY